MRMLFLCHAHPDLQAGGTEIFARDLFRALRQGGAEGLFVAGATAAQRPPSPGTALQAVGEAADEVLLRTGGFDLFHLSQVDLHGVAPALASLVAEVKPDIVHIHHLLTLGVEVVGLVRRVAPRARIVMTLHDYYLICPNDGQMITTAGALCHQAGLDACRACFPDRSLTDLRLRGLHIGQALDCVDHFIAPSHFLRDRFVAWGLPAARISVVANGIPAAPAARHRPVSTGRRDRFAFFGHINRFKGAEVAVDASARLSRDGVAHALALHGGTAWQTDAVLHRFAAALQAAPEARHLGAYRRADMARLIVDADWVVVPSVWWENAPLVIQEALQHRRPLIVSGIGGMAEAVRDGIDGLHAAPGDVAGLARVMRRAADEPDLWQRIVDSMAPPLDLARSVTAHRELYGKLLATASSIGRLAA